MAGQPSERRRDVDDHRAADLVDAPDAGLPGRAHGRLAGDDAVGHVQLYLNIVDAVTGERVLIYDQQDGGTLDELAAPVRIFEDDLRNFKVAVNSGHLLKEQLGDDHRNHPSEKTTYWIAQDARGTPVWARLTYEFQAVWQY